MKKLKTLTLLLGALAVAFTTQAQSADEIVAKYVDAIGGAEKLKGLKTLQQEVVMEIQGMEIPMKTWSINNQATRVEFEVMGTTNVQVVTKTNGWSQMPVQNQPDAKATDTATLRLGQAQLDLTGLYDYKTKGKKVEFKGKETVDGKELYKLQVTNPNGVTANMFIDPATNYLVRIETKTTIQGQEIQTVTTLSDYQKTDYGFAYPSSTSVEPSGMKLTVKKVEVNKPIDESIFKMPAK